VTTGLMLIDAAAPSQEFSGMKVAYSVHGAKNFREPKGFGSSLYDGVHITIFSEEVSSTSKAFFKTLTEKGAKFFQVAGIRVAQMEKKLQEDTWSLWFANPIPNVLLVATNEAYLREVLEGIAGNRRQEVFPNSLPEWEHVDIGSSIWALHHYSSEEKEDPTSPLNESSSGQLMDSGAIGFVANVQSKPEDGANAFYLTNDPEAIPKFKRALKEYLYEIDPSFDTLTGRESPHVLGIKFDDLYDPNTSSGVTVVLSWWLGHGIFM